MAADMYLVSREKGKIIGLANDPSPFQPGSKENMSVGQLKK